jgi:hypothetical protein
MKTYKSIEDIDFETLLKVLTDDSVLAQADVQSNINIYTIRNLFVQLYDSIKDDEYKIDFRQLCYTVVANMHQSGAGLYHTLNLIYHKDYDDVVDKPRRGLSLLVRLTHFNKYIVDMFNDFSRTLARYHLPSGSKVASREQKDYINDLIYIACKGNVANLPLVYQQEAYDVLMFIEQEAKKSYEIQRANAAR